MSSTQIQVVTPAHAPGAVNVVVENSDGQATTLSGAFTYNAAPAISSLSPSLGPTEGGTAVTITGTGFQSGPTVSFGGTNSTAVTFTSTTQLQALTPAHAAGAVNVVVTNPDNQSGSLASGFAYDAAPAISSLSPNSGSVGGGTTVTITGTGFLSGATVTFGGTVAASANVASSTQIQVVTPNHSVGAVDVTVANPDHQSDTRASGFTFQHSVTLSWTPSASVVSGYNVYRGIIGAGGPYTKLNSSLVTSTTYTDNSVQAGQAYFYVVTAVDSNTVESDNSDGVAAFIPSP